MKIIKLFLSIIILLPTSYIFSRPIVGSTPLVQSGETLIYNGSNETLKINIVHRSTCIDQRAPSQTVTLAPNTRFTFMFQPEGKNFQPPCILTVELNIIKQGQKVFLKTIDHAGMYHVVFDSESNNYTIVEAMA